MMSGRIGTEVAAVEITVRAPTGETRATVTAMARDGCLLAWYPEARPRPPPPRC